MRRFLKRALAVTALLAWSSSSAAGWGVAFHLAVDDRHEGYAFGHPSVLGLEMAMHGHAHDEGTPAHGHPFVGGLAAPMPGKLLLQVGSTVGDVEEVVVAETAGRRLVSEAGRTHDPPRIETVTILRI